MFIRDLWLEIYNHLTIDLVINNLWTKVANGPADNMHNNRVYKISDLKTFVFSQSLQNLLTTPPH